MCKIVHFYPVLIDWKVIAQKKKKKIEPEVSSII